MINNLIKIAEYFDKIGKYQLSDRILIKIASQLNFNNIIKKIKIFLKYKFPFLTREQMEDIAQIAIIDLSKIEIDPTKNLDGLIHSIAFNKAVNFINSGYYKHEKSATDLESDYYESAARGEETSRDPMKHWDYERKMRDLRGDPNESYQLYPTETSAIANLSLQDLKTGKSDTDIDMSALFGFGIPNSQITEHLRKRYFDMLVKSKDMLPQGSPSSYLDKLLNDPSGMVLLWTVLQNHLYSQRSGADSDGRDLLRNYIDNIEKYNEKNNTNIKPDYIMNHAALNMRPKQVISMIQFIFIKNMFNNLIKNNLSPAGAVGQIIKSIGKTADQNSLITISTRSNNSQKFSAIMKISDIIKMICLYDWEKWPSDEDLIRLNIPFQKKGKGPFGVEYKGGI
ncbi:MAG: hypothetical protein UT24_C0018G0013 [Candidatus Woesebacteria bacterium GW2011_GWB1_39_12]|uniref:Uncharacterized protein n=1 Tax=Candidatus Woesebacteria bacterium GW2011_GWB1_39_12 TaxID=1618574 RepID=A0A0G0MI27_9BACT|nr:MAG: hypothetical protein UT24_C0018G0013 [Candidatus Woesebacteria bacterium GW2011_GWB1_39_12]